MSKIRKVNDWHPELRSAMKTVRDVGFSIEAASDGEIWTKASEGDSAMLNTLDTCDEAWLRCTKDGQRATFYFVLGNSPGELIADVSYHESLEAVTDEVIELHSTKWEGRNQPTKSEVGTEPAV